jgi:NSS family neurotransmitter:Na+ symporter
LVFTGILEVVVDGWCFKTSKVLDEINKNTDKFKMPAWWFGISIKFIAPVVLSVLFVWNLVTLFAGGGIYGAADGYSLTANIIGGWLVMALSLISGFVVKLVARNMAKKGYVEEEVTWEKDEA